MICFLTSRTDHPETGALNPDNGFAEALRKALPSPCRAVVLASDPDSPEITDYYAGLTRQCFAEAGIRFSSFRVLDGRNREKAAALVGKADLLILSGGHVPTQNRFFRSIGLRRLLRDFDGVIVGISAGSMNCAEVVYAQPEEEGEALDPGYRRFLPGLGLTKTMLLPHYQQIKDDVLDGLRIFEDIACPDSMGRTIYAIPDGTYLYIGPEGRELRGEAIMIRDGVMRQVSAAGGVLRL